MNTLLLAFALASALAASAVLGRSSGPTPERLTYVEEERIRGQVDETAQVVAVGDRSANLKYVMAIQSSSMWTDIKRRSLTTNSARRLDDAAADKPPNDLSDEELARLKQACHDGLKCVAVDQLLVLKRVREPLADGNTSVRMAITKITQVISKYTSEYHEDVYQYEEVTQSDDPSKVYESVTNIVEDNEELCQIDVSAVDAGKENATGPPENSDGGEDDARPTTVVNNNNTVNFNTTKNYNINNGTVNNATVNMAAPEGADGVSVTLSSDDGPAAENGSPDDADRQPTGRSTAADGSPPTGNGSSAAVSPENASPPVDSRPPALLMITDESYHDTAASASNTPNVDGGSSRRDADGAGGNTATIVNRSGGGSGTNDSDADVVSAGPHNRADVKKGLVEDGYFNNGNMKVKNFDRSNRNKGTIKNSSADHGIIGIGTINNGPVNYGTTNVYKNDGTIADIGNLDIQAYATSIDKMYSAILNKLANKD